MTQRSLDDGNFLVKLLYKALTDPITEEQMAAARQRRLARKAARQMLPPQEGGEALPPQEGGEILLYISVPQTSDSDPLAEQPPTS